jgi:rubrerythrin
MEEQVLTASAVMRFAEELEDDSAAFYQALADRFEAGRETFLRFVKESKRNKTELVRTYQETITDALEATFSFEGLNLPSFDLAAKDVSRMEFGEAVALAIETEGKATELYRQIAAKAHSLLATIPRAFSRVAGRRAERVAALQSLLAPPEPPAS